MSKNTETPTISRQQAETLYDLLNGINPKPKYPAGTYDFRADVEALVAAGFIRVYEHTLQALYEGITQSGRDYVREYTDQKTARTEYQRVRGAILMTENEQRAEVLAVIRVSEYLGRSMEDVVDLIWPPGSED